MAPDLNSLQSNGKWDYSTPGSEGYSIPNITYNMCASLDPSTRRMKVITIGAGFSGILLAYRIQKHCQNVEHVIYEKNADIGDTWLEIRYPGCACDIPSHAYTMNFALNPDWPRFFLYAPDIHKYLCKICDAFDLRKYMTFNTEVVSLRQKSPAGEVQEFDEECDLLLYATGIMNNFKWPDIPGLKKFKGRVVHTAYWTQDYQEDQWKQDRVAIIGSGASSIQTVPKIQPHVKAHGHICAYRRLRRKETFRSNPEALLAHARDIEGQVNSLWSLFYNGTEAQKESQKVSKARMKEIIKDERLLEGFTPKFEIGCRSSVTYQPRKKLLMSLGRRITPGDPYMEAIQKDNVDVNSTPVDEITEKGVIGADGKEREVDTVICATGFDRPRFPIIGKNGVKLYRKWDEEPQSYLGMGCSDMPNWLMYIGTTYADKRTAVWPGSSLQYSEVTETPRYEDFHIEYLHKNPWAHMGMGFSMTNTTEGSDLSPCLQLENIDPKWWKGCGLSGISRRGTERRKESKTLPRGLDLWARSDCIRIEHVVECFWN
ncbi:FAD/NAD(P)-binding domain-containing protein [Karstenula rhodostoma CBS 690.94]|uniref:FAD/NAD(P)-binding domain-containing protein n=1 Tax=Karstenula rhodostoma CBS 690.94 TaxID=1392251 RepID=A0A9P4PIJ4_9PLEO|nr:FAD/NAD(P)-binding domain-containing protein [Karstenula rhodostoma CBS 690.94]